MRESIVDLVKESKVLCPYFHLPIQAGSNKILELMNRGYTKERYLEIASYIRDTIPDASIGTDIIVGFPEETEADFQQTLEVVEKVQFEIAYTFAYSPRPKTRASSMADSVPPQEKKRRLLELNQLVRKVYQKRVEKLRGKTVALLIDKQEKTFSGRTPSNLRVFVESGVKDSLKPGDMLLVKITEIRDGKIFAEKA
jgi:tRNA-2-methylthio-N6-dimethylallyladenosine synthase